MAETRVAVLESSVATEPSGAATKPKRPLRTCLVRIVVVAGLAAAGVFVLYWLPAQRERRFLYAEAKYRLDGPAALGADLSPTEQIEWRGVVTAEMRITDNQIDELLAEGDARDWPTTLDFDAVMPLPEAERRRVYYAFLSAREAIEREADRVRSLSLDGRLSLDYEQRSTSEYIAWVTDTEGLNERLLGLLRLEGSIKQWRLGDRLGPEQRRRIYETWLASTAKIEDLADQAYGVDGHLELRATYEREARDYAIGQLQVLWNISSDELWDVIDEGTEKEDARKAIYAEYRTGERALRHEAEQRYGPEWSPLHEAHLDGGLDRLASLIAEKHDINATDLGDILREGQLVGWGKDAD